MATMRLKRTYRMDVWLAGHILGSIVLTACVTVVLPTAVPSMPTATMPTIATVVPPTETQVATLIPTTSPTATIVPPPVTPTIFPSATSFIVKMPVLGMFGEAWAWKSTQYVNVTGFYRGYCQDEWCPRPGYTLISLYIHCNSPYTENWNNAGCTPGDFKLIDGLGYTISPSDHSLYPSLSVCEHEDGNCDGWLGFEVGDTPAFWGTLTMYWRLIGNIKLNLPDTSQL
jgi:hypothetical protein